MLKTFEPRLYQQTILATTINYNTLVVLPTGMGKTAQAFMLAAQRLKQHPGSKVLVLSPTKPLVEQHYQSFLRHLEIDEEKVAMFTGNVKPELRHKQFREANVIISTPQGLENDIISNKISFEDVSLLVFDEAHRAVGDYSYVWLAKRYNQLARYPRVLALTASPGSELEKIAEIIQNLYIEEVEIRTDRDPDLKPYLQEVKIKWVKVDMSESLLEVHTTLKNCFKSKLKEIQKYGYLQTKAVDHIGKVDLLKLQGYVQSELAQGNKGFEVLKTLSIAAEALKVQHAIELIETQGVTALCNYLESIQEQSKTTKTKAVINLVNDVLFKTALIKARALQEKGIEHPKVKALQNAILERIYPGAKLIVFSQYRDSGTKIVEELNKLAGVKARLFVGQQKKGESGLSQKKQIEMLNDFRDSVFNVLVSTSVGEEGLDIPQVDSVLFYEPIPSAIRTIQRKGRTGRLEKGEVVILMTNKTRDEGYRWAAHHKEKRMYSTLDALKKKMRTMMHKKEEVTLDKFTQPSEEIKIVCDYREKGSPLIKQLIEQGVKLDLQQLGSGDYILSSRCAIEFKQVEDFVDSLIDGRLLQQVKDLKAAFDKPLVLVEGDRDIFSIRNVTPNAIRGAISSILIDFGVPILFTKNHLESANMLIALAKREQGENKKGVYVHGDRKPLTSTEQQEFIISALPGVGGNLAKQLLEKFGSIKGVFEATEEELKEVELVGEKKAKTIREIIEKNYQP